MTCGIPDILQMINSLIGRLHRIPVVIAEHWSALLSSLAREKSTHQILCTNDGNCIWQVSTSHHEVRSSKMGETWQESNKLDSKVLARAKGKG
jgi:hypothetical protein